MSVLIFKKAFLSEDDLSVFTGNPISLQSTTTTAGEDYEYTCTNNRKH
jgi:hypothetical protein